MVKKVVIKKILGMSQLQFITKRLPFNYKKFWKKRYEKHGFDTLCCGGLGRTIEKNKEYLRQRRMHLSNFLNKLGVDDNSSVLDVGCGVGEFTQLFKELGFKNYKGIDIQEGVINKLKEKHNGYKFEAVDICEQKIEGNYDLIVMFSVTQHIIKDTHFKFIMKNIENALNKNGLFLVTDMLDVNKRDGIYTRRRPLSYYKKILNLKYVDMIDFETLKLFCFTKR